LKSPAAPTKLLLMDACVLIDFIKADPSILALIAENIGPVYVLNTILEEVDQIQDEEELIQLGLIIVEAEMEDAYAAVEVPGPLSFYDHLFFLTARRHGFSCITNDNNLRKLCIKNNIPLYWGLELLIELHTTGKISSDDAKTIAQSMHDMSPKYITPKLVDKFLEIIHRTEKKFQQ